jgi:hypothetical protein
MLEGIEYYQQLFATSSFFKQGLSTINNQLQEYKLMLNTIEIPQLKSNRFF